MKQAARISEARNLPESDSKLLHARFLLSLFLDPEDGGDMFL
jgi:hypothetical protein